MEKVLRLNEVPKNPRERDAAVERVRALLVDQRRCLTNAQFRSVESGWRSFLRLQSKKRSLGVPAMSIVFFLRSVFLKELSWDDVFAARSAWEGKTFKNMNLGKRLKVPKSFRPRRLIGETLIALKACQPDDIDAGLLAQETIEKATGVRLLLGELLVKMGRLDFNQHYHSIAIHFGIPYRPNDPRTLESIRTAQLKHVQRHAAEPKDVK